MSGAQAAQTAPAGITGTVTDAAGAVVPGAAVEARNLETGARYRTVSRDTGHFTLENLPAGEYELKVSLAGFRRFYRSGIPVRSGRPAEIPVTLEIESISEAVTVRTHSPLGLLETPGEEPAVLQASISTVDRIRIEQQGAKTIVDALAYVPGAWVETRGRKVKQFVSVRGQKYPYPEYSVDGVIFREFHEVPFLFSAEDVERVEVLRSSASLLQGFSGIAGVIDIVPRRYETRETNWLAEYASRNSYRVHLAHGDSVGDISYGLGLESSRAGGPEDRLGDERMLNLFGSIGWQATPALSMRANFFHMQGRQELVQATPPATNRFQNAVETYDPIQTSVVTLNTLYKPSDRGSTRFTVGYSNRHNTFIAETQQGVTATPDYDSEWNLNLVQSLALSGDNVLRIGANYNNWISPYGKRFYAGRRSHLETASFSVVDEHTFGSLVLDGGLRYQRTYINEYGAFNIDGSGGQFSSVDPIMDTWDAPQLHGSLGATWFLTNRVALRGNFLTGSVEPRTGSLAEAGEGEYETPETERRTMVDAGIQATAGGIGEFTAAGFYIRQSDAIVLSGQTVENETTGSVIELYQNRDQDTAGIEFEYKSRPLYERIHFLFNFTAMNPRVLDDEGSMERDIEKPRAILSSGILGKQWKLDYNFFWKYVSGYESSRFASSLQPLGGFHAFSLTVGHPLGAYENTRVYLELTNLTDSRYATVVGYPDYGRSFRIGIRQVIK
ncbi:MAG: TonB-dependent receptor [Acidobacteria bacterium]|nr:TonB-dependent receptor [Acidobacteriota bacterium]